MINVLNTASRKHALGAAVLLSALMSTGAAQAVVAVTDISGGNAFTTLSFTDQTVGWQFTANDDITVTHLGFYDNSPFDPLSTTHEVGLWTPGGMLLASTTIQTTSTLVGSFRFEAVTPVALTAGSSYLIGGAFTLPLTADAYRIPTARTIAPEITINGSARNADAGGFGAPTIVSVGNGRFGPNFQFTVTAPPPPIPEPGTYALMGLGLVGLAGLGRLRRRH
ncbi:DUF4082 domain-containing protein [Piscinibacter sp. Jin2]|uniref:DUF4082 domain-containing protein n=1 Tax=Aquariibacter lacus TaxID=2801332 RepID=A0A9X0XEM5_9BURK|nr:DUF4082 domain-containing protein [Piscinibacter lacus]MBL0719437.1 DUF4082 domain-containing protein [Piscinibacter lacus]